MMDSFMLWHIIIALLMMVIPSGIVSGDETTTISSSSANVQNNTIDFQDPLIASEKEDISPQGNVNLNTKTTTTPKAINSLRDNKANNNNNNIKYRNTTASSTNKHSTLTELKKNSSLESNDLVNKNRETETGNHRNNIVRGKEILGPTTEALIPSERVKSPHSGTAFGDQQGILYRSNETSFNDEGNTGNLSDNMNETKSVNDEDSDIVVVKQGNTGKKSFLQHNNTLYGSDGKDLNRNSPGNSQMEKNVRIPGSGNNQQEESNLKKGKWFNNQTGDSPGSLQSPDNRKVNTVNGSLILDNQHLSEKLSTKNKQFEKGKITINVTTSKETKYNQHNSLNESTSTVKIGNNSRVYPYQQEEKFIVNKSIRVNNLTTVLPSAASPVDISQHQTYQVKNKTDNRDLSSSKINFDDSMGKDYPANSAHVVSNQSLPQTDNITLSDDQISYKNMGGSPSHSDVIPNGYIDHNSTYINHQESNLLSDLVDKNNTESSEEDEVELNYEWSDNKNNSVINNISTTLHGDMNKPLTAEITNNNTSLPNYSDSVQAITPAITPIHTTLANTTGKFLYYTYKDKLLEEDKVTINNDTSTTTQSLLNILSSTVSSSPVPNLQTDVNKGHHSQEYNSKEWDYISEEDDDDDDDTYGNYDDTEDGEDHYIINGKNYISENGYEYYEDTDEQQENDTSQMNKIHMEGNSDQQWLQHMENVEERLIDTNTHDDSKGGSWSHDPFHHRIEHSFLKDNSLSLMVFYTWLAVVTFMLIISYVAFKHRQTISNFITDKKISYRRRRSLRTEEGHQLLSANPYA